MLDRITKKQSDADEIKRWRQDLTNAFEHFNVYRHFRLKFDVFTDTALTDRRSSGHKDACN
jgi:ABC-type histidine transport system ATPase subunit